MTKFLILFEKQGAKSCEKTTNYRLTLILILINSKKKNVCVYF